MKRVQLYLLLIFEFHIYREREREAIVGDRIDEDKVGYETPCPTILKNFGWSSHDGGCHHMVWMELLMLTKFSLPKTLLHLHDSLIKRAFYFSALNLKLTILNIYCILFNLYSYLHMQGPHGVPLQVDGIALKS